MISRVGSIELLQIVERGRVLVPAQAQFPGLDDADVDVLMRIADPRTIEASSRSVVLSFHSWVIRSQGVVVLVDPCVGNRKERPTIPYLDGLDTDYLDQLAMADLDTADVDFVVSTHQHVDHVGWNTMWSGDAWVPTFPAATYLWSEEEFERFDAMHRAGQLANHGAHADSMLPVIQSGLGRLLGPEEIDGFEVAPGITLHRAPGHTPGSIVIWVREGSDSALLAGDAIHHVHQVAEPGVANHADVDADQARRTRERLLAECAASGALLAPAHFPGTGIGHVMRSDSGYTFNFLKEHVEETS